MLNKIKFFAIHLQNILPLYFLLVQDIYALFRLLFSKSSRKNQTTFLTNQRSWGFGHQILELRYARKVAQKCDATILATRKFANKFLHKKMTDGCIKTVIFNFDFSYDIATAHIEKSRKHLDVGGSPNEIASNLAVQYKMQFKLAKSANAGYKRIYDSFQNHDFSDLPQFFSSSEESLLFKKLKNCGIDPHNWYCVLHIRNGGGWSKIRDTNLETYHQSIEEIIKQGGQVLLTGNDLSSRNSQNLPYLPHNAKSDLRLFALAKQKMMIASCSGPAHASFLFDIPVVTTNNIFWEFFTWSYKDSSLPKMIRNKETGELLNRTQYMELRIRDRYSNEGIHSDYESVENTSDEILTAVKNKLEELKTKDFSSKICQKSFRDSFDESFYIHSTFSKIDNSYYEKYQNIFDN
jgi:putative glycosyltransferase (TIGR04372 family)